MGLNAKTYFCQGPSSVKYSSKGISHQVQLNYEQFKAVLSQEQINQQTNKGFRVKNDAVYTYQVKKSGLVHQYVKRKLLSDGISTTYLDC